MLQDIFSKAFFAIKFVVFVIVITLVLTQSVVPPQNLTERVRSYTRDKEFDYISWTVNALWLKFNMSALGIDRYLTDEQNSQTVLSFIDMTRRIQMAESEYRSLLSDPTIEDKEAVAADVQSRLDQDYELRSQLGPLAESILQAQIASVLKEEGLVVGGQTVPPVLYHMTPAPMALIISPRNVIQQLNNISIQPEMTIEAQIALEDEIAEGLDVSTLIVPIGGIGLYPTMVTQTSNINWLANTISHEWAHNYFTLRPLGISYLTTAALRTMNETAASLFGNEIGRIVIEKYYPASAPPPPQPPPDPSETEEDEDPPPPPEPVFDFRAEMRETRLNADRLLAEGEIELAEQYMELRRRFFFDNGYRGLRKINQAYFAFYGAYADSRVGRQETIRSRPWSVRYMNKVILCIRL
jgi:hypothetical protein